MNTDLLEIQPQELKFIFELKRQSTCSVRLVNKSNHHVAFKVKTTSPKKYCVRPNTGVIEPKSTCDFTVTMQAQRVPPPDLICKDKFLVQSTAVSLGTVEEDITPITFAKDDGKYVEERKLKVILVSPPHSPVLSPMNQTSKQVQPYEAIASKDEVLSKGQTFSPPAKIIDHMAESAMGNCEDLEPMKDAESTTMKDLVELRLAKDIEEMKSKLKELESKLSEAEITISKLTDERRFTTEERLSLQGELEMLRTKSGLRKKVQVGFPLLFVCMVALVSLFLGHHLRN